MKILSEKILKLLKSAKTKKEEFNNEIFGNILVYYLNENKFIIEKSQTTNNKSIFENFSHQTEERMKINNKYLLKMIGINEEEKNIEKETIYKITVFYEFSGITLRDFFLEAKKNQKKLSEKFLMNIIGDILKSINFLKKNRIIHGNISPSYISIEKNCCFKLIDQLVVRFLDKNIYISPDIFENKKNINFYKSEIFSLGLIILELGILKPINDIYNFKEKKFNYGILNSYIKLFLKNYQKNLLLTKIVKIMLGYETKRKGIKNLLNYYTNQINKKKQREMLELKNNFNQTLIKLNSEFKFDKDKGLKKTITLSSLKINNSNESLKIDKNLIKEENQKEKKNYTKSYEKNSKNNSKEKIFINNQTVKFSEKKKSFENSEEEYEIYLINKICDSDYNKIKNQELKKMNDSSNDIYNSEKSLISNVCNSDYYFIKNEELEKMNRSKYNYYHSNKSLTYNKDKYVVIDINEKDNLEKISEKNLYNESDIIEKVNKNYNKEIENENSKENLNLNNNKIFSKIKKKDINFIIDSKIDCLDNNKIINEIETNEKLKNDNDMYLTSEINIINKKGELINNNIENLQYSDKKLDFIDSNLEINLISKKSLLNVRDFKLKKTSLNFKKVKNDGRNFKRYTLQIQNYN